MDQPHQPEPRIVVPWKQKSAGYMFEKKDNSWFVISEVPTNLSVQVEDMTFYVHKKQSSLTKEERHQNKKAIQFKTKYALVSKSGYINQIAFQPISSEHNSDIKLDKFPGGPKIFEVVLRYCYSLPIDLSSHNVAPLRCASEYLEMTEEFEDGNLISKTEAFLMFIVLASWRDSIMVLNSCQHLSPWAENLQIVRRCCDSISLKACQDRSTSRELNCDETWWFDDLATLRIDHFIRIMSALRAKRFKPEVIGSCIMHYADKWLPGMNAELQTERSKGNWQKELQLCISSRNNQEESSRHNKEQRLIIESLVSILPTQKEAVPCQFLLWMLKMAMVYSITPALISELEKRVGIVLQDASVKDLLIPSCGHSSQEMLLNSPDERTMHNTDVVQRIVEYFLMHEQLLEQQELKFEKFSVSKLLDGYLAEIAKDPNLTIAKFHVLAESLPQNARVCHDGLYRAIDTYLKSHPSLSDQDRRRLCKIMSCEKLSLDACMHAAQNDRLPLKTIVQVLFSEQVKMRTVMQGKEQTNSDTCDQDESWSTTKREVKALKVELENIKTEMAELQRDYTELQREYEKLISKRGNSGWSWKRIRTSSLFHRKTYVEDNAQQQMSNQDDDSVNLRRRLTIS
ncbi:hypothetical protein V2J09_016312 [Rumex salicifolius]